MLKFIYFIFGIILSVTIILSVFQLIVFDQKWYNRQFAQQEVYLNFPPEQVSSYWFTLRAFFGGLTNLSEEDFTPKEIIHLEDIRHLIHQTKMIHLILSILLGLVFILILWHYGLWSTVKIFLFGSIWAVLIHLLVISLFLIDFDFWFTVFHQTVFNNSAWLLDPQTDKLVVIFPPELWQQFIMRLVKVSLFIDGILIFILSTLYFIFKRHLRTRKLILTNLE